jgi:cell division protein FtsQ
MKRPEGFDSGRVDPPAPEVRAPRGAASRGPKTARQPAPKQAGQGPTKEPKAPKPPRPRREKPAPTEAELAARSARAQARASRKDARRARRERQSFERAEVRRFTRRARNRRLAWLSAGGVVTVLGVLIATAVYSPLLALDEIRVTGTSRLDPVVVHDAIDGQLGTPLALVDFDRLTSELSEFALIRSYVTETVPPHTLVIHISERQPAASVLTDSGYLLVDPAGIEIERTETRPPGVPMLDMSEDAVGGDVFDAIIEVLLALPAPVLAQVDQVSASTLDDVTLVFAGAGQRVVWGSADRSDLKARVLEKLMAVHDPATPVEFDVTAPLSAVVRPL